jgi:hypothetical protein
MKYPLTYLANNNIIHDWVQLPTKDEMDLWRKENTPVWKCKQKLIITSKIWETKKTFTMK